MNKISDLCGPKEDPQAKVENVTPFSSESKLDMFIFTETV